LRSGPPRPRSSTGCTILRWQNHPARSFESSARSTTFAPIVSIGAHYAMPHAANTARIGIELRNASVCVASTSARKPMGFACAAIRSGRRRQMCAVCSVRRITPRTKRRNERSTPARRDRKPGDHVGAGRLCYVLGPTQISFQDSQALSYQSSGGSDRSQMFSGVSKAIPHIRGRSKST